MKLAAAGIGRPLKYLESTMFFWTLNRASRRAPQVTYINEASQPNRPNGPRAH